MIYKVVDGCQAWNDFAIDSKTIAILSKVGLWLDVRRVKRRYPGFIRRPTIPTMLSTLRQDAYRVDERNGSCCTTCAGH